MSCYVKSILCCKKIYLENIYPNLNIDTKKQKMNEKYEKGKLNRLDLNIARYTDEFSKFSLSIQLGIALPLFATSSIFAYKISKRPIWALRLGFRSLIRRPTIVSQRVKDFENIRDTIHMSLSKKLTTNFLLFEVRKELSRRRSLRMHWLTPGACPTPVQLIPAHLKTKQLRLCSLNFQIFT